MGFYYRKSVKLGPLKFNFSKSGVGVSVGMKGFRIGTGPKGNYVHMGRNGVYYRKTIGKKEKTAKQSEDKNNEISVKSHDNDLYFEKVESQNVSEILDSSSEQLVNEINEKRRMFSFKWLSLFGLFNIWIFIVLFIIFHMIDKMRKTVVIVYNIDDDMQNELQSFYDSFKEMNRCSQKWQIVETRYNEDYKRNAGVSNVITRKNISINEKLPSFIKTNVMVPCIKLVNGSLCFLPDKLLIIKGKEVGALSYGNVCVKRYDEKFVETATRPSDAKILEYTWKYVNKSGERDRRYSENPKIPVVNYSHIDLSSENGLNEKMMFSKSGIGEKFVLEIQKLKGNNYDDNFDKVKEVLSEKDIVENVDASADRKDEVEKNEIENMNVENVHDEVNQENESTRKNMFLKDE